jgi:hypothetical protein
MIKRIFLFFLKVIYILPFFVIGLWLISVVYFPSFSLDSSVTMVKYDKTQDTADVMAAQKKEEAQVHHFHITDKYVERLDEERQICDQCHGAYAHGKNKKVRALLNLHTGYLACTVCHVRKDGGEGLGGATLKAEITGYTWVDNDTGEFKASATGEYGKFSEMIFPVMSGDQGDRRIYRPVTDSAAQRFLDNKLEWTEKQLDEERVKLHEKISKEAITCTDCHKKDGYIDFAALGYPKQRVDHLISNEVVGMIENYKTFYLPSVVDFRGE